MEKPIEKGNMLLRILEKFDFVENCYACMC